MYPLGFLLHVEKVAVAVHHNDEDGYNKLLLLAAPRPAPGHTVQSFSHRYGVTGTSLVISLSVLKAFILL